MTREVDADARFWTVPVLAAVGPGDASVRDTGPAVVAVAVRAAPNRLAETEITAFVIGALIVVRAGWVQETDVPNAERTVGAVFVGTAFPYVQALVSDTCKPTSAIAVVSTFDVSLALA